MNKSQRQLTDTYFRKRKIAGDQNILSRYKNYEFNYLMKNIPININKFSSHDIPYILKDQPSLISYFKDRLDELKVYDIEVIHY